MFHIQVDNIQDDFGSDYISEASSHLTSKKKNAKNMSLRMDVIKKTIFRSFKQYLRNEFKAFYDFTKFRRGSKIPHQIIFEQAEKFVTTKLGSTDSNNIAMYLVAIVDTKRKFKHSNSNYVSISKKMNSLLRKFNNTKAETLLRLKEFCQLFKYFLSIPVYQISRNKEDQRVLDAYQIQIDCLREQCDVALNGGK